MSHDRFRKPPADVEALRDCQLHGRRCPLPTMVQVCTRRNSRLMVVKCPSPRCDCAASLQPGGRWVKRVVSEDFDPRPDGTGNTNQPPKVAKPPEMESSRRSKIQASTARYWQDLKDYAAELGIATSEVDRGKFGKWRKGRAG